MHQLTDRPLRLAAAAAAVLTAALLAALLALPREQATATGERPSCWPRHLAQAGHRVPAATRGPIDVATVHVTFQPGGSTGWHVHPGPALVTVKTGQLTLHRAKGCRTAPPATPTPHPSPATNALAAGGRADHRGRAPPTPLPAVAEPTIPGRGPTPARLSPLAFLASPVPGWQGAQSKPQRSEGEQCSTTLDPTQRRPSRSRPTRRGCQRRAGRQLLELADGDTLDLRVGPVAKRLGDTTVRMLGYNGSIPGPTLKVQQGSEIVVHVTNEGDLDTTVHWHGLRLENKYDGVPHETQAPIPVGGRVHLPHPVPRRRACTGTTPTSVRTTPRSWACTATSWSGPPSPTTGRRSTASSS